MTPRNDLMRSVKELLLTFLRQTTYDTPLMWAFEFNNPSSYFLLVQNSGRKLTTRL